VTGGVPIGAPPLGLFHSRNDYAFNLV
jgi:hypothetical protein